ncbi:hypothetical protein ACEPAF_5275 [Sanghuangporus sanghuang]
MPGIVTELRRQADTSALSATVTATIESKSNGVPEIGGSEGGFIGLIVGLGVIFIGSCIGVFYLLRNYKHGGRTVPGKSGEVGVEASSGGPSFPRRRGTLFGFRSQNPKRAGWIRAPGDDEEDEWDANDTLGMGPYDPGRDSFVKLEGSTHNLRSAPQGEVTVPNLDYAARASPGRRKDESSVSTVDLQAPSRIPEDEPFEPPLRSTSPATMDDDTLAHYPAYIDQLNRTKDGQPRQTSLDSTETAVTFPGGTRFKEEL